MKVGCSALGTGQLLVPQAMQLSPVSRTGELQWQIPSLECQAQHRPLVPQQIQAVPVLLSVSNEGRD